jgi:16S rRNA (guanine527-N7)-methyltransferase
MVTRETSISAGLEALGLAAFAGNAKRLAEYAELVSTEARTAGLIGERETDRLVVRHILESCALLRYIADEPIADVGSGAGLPGLPIAIASGRPVTFVESRARAAAFLRSASAALGVSAGVVQMPAEDAARTDLREAAGIVVARALAPPPVALELTLPFARTGGSVLLLVGPSAHELVGPSTEAAAALGGAAPRYEPLEVPGATGQIWVMIVGKVDQTAERFPRRPGVPRRRPLGGRVTGVE